MTIFPRRPARSIATKPQNCKLGLSDISPFGRSTKTIKSTARKLITFPVVMETKENSVFRCACKRDMTELFMSPKSVNTPVISIPAIAIGELYPGRKNPMASDRRMIIPPKTVRSVNIFPTILWTFLWSFLCSLISRTVMV